MKKITLKTTLGIVASFFALSVNGQCPTITCPGDISVNNDSGQCGAVVNYTAPQGTDPCANQTVTFTNCGATGRLGPTQTQVNSEYSGGPLAGQVTITTQGKQEWTVPSTGTYTIEVAGARGGNADATYQGGLGAVMQGDVSLTAGDQLVIIVGQSGQDVVYAGGGGASAVSLNGNPLIVAGGGGGGNSITNANNGYDAVTGTSGVASMTPGGTGGNGSDGGYAQGGAGYLSNGQNIGLSGISVPQSLQGSAIGGEGYQSSYWGSFGGGGSGFGGGGGGGGYSGGSGGTYNCCTSVEASGGGGGSFNSGTNQSNSAGTNAGHGYVTITGGTAGTVTTTQITGLASGSIFPVGTTTNTFEVSNGNGNTATCSFDIIVGDAESPTSDLPSLADVESGCEVNSLHEPTATDNCDGTIFGTHNATFPITSNTTVTWTYTDGEGNSSTQTQNVVISGVNVNVIVSEPILTAANSETGVTYQWIDCDNGDAPVSGATTQSFTPLANGNYAVIVTQGNCSDTSACEMISTISLNQQSISGFKLYPNPNNGQFTVESTEIVELYTVFDVNGRLVHEASPKSTSFKVELGDCETGLYYLHINEEIIKVIKE